MDARRNAPILVSLRSDGTVLAECILMPGVRCVGSSRAAVLATMQKLLVGMAPRPRLPAGSYEIVHLALPATEEAPGPHRSLASTTGDDLAVAGAPFAIAVMAADGRVA